MKRGTIVLVGGYEHPLLPGFTRGGTFPVTVLSIMSKWLRDQGFAFEDQSLKSPFEMYHGDWLKGGRGEVFIR
jgi:hypothetical protein